MERSELIERLVPLIPPPRAHQARQRLAAVLPSIGAAVTFFACATIEKSEAIKTERTLAAAGFQMRLADTPQRMAKLQAMTQRKLVPHEKDGRIHFVYAPRRSPPP